MHLFKNVESFICVPSLRRFTNRCVPIPKMSDQMSFDDIKELIEWIDAQVAQIDCNQSDEPDVSSFGYNNIESHCDVTCISLSGFFTPSDIFGILDKVKKLKDNELKSIIVHGFEDIPLSWAGNNAEHGKCLSGENLYGFACKNNNYFVWRLGDEYDFGIERL